VFIELAPQDVVARHLRTMREDRASADDVEDSEAGAEINLEDSSIIDGDFDIVD